MTKTVYGLGFPTPSATEAATLCRIVQLPDDTAFLSVFMGALALLENPDNWQQIGDMTPEESAQAFVDIIYDMYQNNTCFVDVEAPFWDDGTDADAEAPADDQPWYGELVEVMSGMGAAEPTLEWHEELRLWIVTAFVAYAGTPAAAIAFYPFARKFVLAFKAGTAGAIVRVFFDGLHLANIDTYGVEDTIINFLVDVGVEPSGEALWVEHSGEHNPDAEPDANGHFTIGVVRKQLDANEFSPTNLRYNPDTDVVQQTYDDGTTWVDNPGQDPRHSTTYQFPPVVADDPRCQAAANQVRFLKNTIDQALSVISLGTDAAGLALTLLPLFVELGPFAILFELVLALADGLVALGADAISSAFTSDVYDQLTCIFYCNIEDDGTVTADDLSIIEGAIGDQIGGVVQAVLDAMLFLTGEVGLTNEGTIGDAPADCSACICCPVETVYDLTVNDGGFVNEANTWGQMHTNIGTYSAGVGWTTTDTTFYSASQRAMDIGLSFTEVNVLKVTIEFEITVANYDEILVQVVGSGGVVFTYDPINPSPPHSSGSLVVYASGSGGLGNHITIAACPGYSPPSGSFVLTKVTICHDA